MKKLSLIVGLLVASVSMANANERCGPRDLVAIGLQTKYGELPQFYGLNDEGVLFELWGNPATPSWTIILTTPDGVTCFLSAGRDFATGPQLPPNM